MSVCAVGIGLSLCLSIVWSEPAAPSPPAGDLDEMEAEALATAPSFVRVEARVDASGEACGIDASAQVAVPDAPNAQLLQEEDLLVLLAQIEAQAAHVARALDALHVRMDRGSVEDLAAEAELLRRRAITRASADALRRAEYRVTNAEDARSFCVAPGHRKELLGCTRAGKPALLVVLLSCGRYPELQDASDVGAGPLR